MKSLNIDINLIESINIELCNKFSIVSSVSCFRNQLPPSTGPEQWLAVMFTTLQIRLDVFV